MSTLLINLHLSPWNNLFDHLRTRFIRRANIHISMNTQNRNFAIIANLPQLLGKVNRPYGPSTALDSQSVGILDDSLVACQYFLG